MTLSMYLCGSVAGRSTKIIREERQYAAAQIRDRGMVPIDPLAAEYDMLKGRRNIQDDQSGLTAANIVRKDSYLITKRSDLLLWLTADIASYGSCIEAGLAWALGIPIISIDPSRKGRRSAFVEHISTYIADDLEDALDWVASYMALPQQKEEVE